MATSAATTTTATGKRKKSSLRLHVYDHCPYCIRVELALGWNGVPYERIVYGYGDRLGDDGKKDDANCYDGGVVLTGKKELPVLESVDASDGGTREWIKAESLDIIDWVLREHKDAASSSSTFPKRSDRDDLKKFFASDGRFKVVQRLLTRPRSLRMTDLTDWAKEEDRLYARAKYERGGFDYDAAESADGESKAEMEKLLRHADEHLLGTGEGGTSLYESGILGFDDLLYLPELRTLTMVEGLAWPDRLKQYVVFAFDKADAKVDTYFDHQVSLD